MKWIGIGLLFTGMVALLAWAAASGYFAAAEEPGHAVAIARGADIQTKIEVDQAGGGATVGAPAGSQILFGDFHVHTTFSFDAFLMNMPMTGGIGTRPPADACDFARFCSGLDFWSINDHAENLTQDLWQKTVEAVRECNAIAGDPTNPDLVTYLGWEWSQIGSAPENHYGHKNVILRGLADDEIPARPIASRGPATVRGALIPPIAQRLGIVALNGSRGVEFNRLLRRTAEADRCADDVPVRDLPIDCLESTVTPEALFAKLDDWGLPSIVIPHGTSWGMYTPAGSDWAKQLPGNDPSRQSLVEIYSGHGNSEQLPRWREVTREPDGSFSCPPPTAGYLPSCWRAGQLIAARCEKDGEPSDVCAQRVARARQNYVDAFQAGWTTLPGYTANDWLDSGQAPGMFQPAFNYRPLGSVQYMLALRDFSDPANPKRFDFGFLGSSDTHTASPGTGYKEVARGEMTDGRGRRGDGPVRTPSLFGGSAGDEPVAESVPFVSSGQNPLQLFEIERASAYFVTGGLVAVHSAGRSREAIWDALERKSVYATSGRRTLLWFDKIDGASSLGMGSKTSQAGMPRFRVRALGSFEQKPGCPEDSIAALGEERIQSICQGECYHPGDARRPISRIEVVRIRPQIHAGEPVDGLVEDPWRVLPCPADGQGCVVEFSDPAFAASARDAVYYVRAIEAVAPTIHGIEPFGCKRDESGACISVDPCGMRAPADDDCLTAAEPRAWSSPIYVDFSG